MELETMRPNPVWDETAYEESLATFAALADRITVRVWGGDWCTDCRKQLPDFGAALAAAGLDPAGDRVVQYPVEKAEDGSKVGPDVEPYGIEYIPTVVVELDGEAVARFVEEASVPIVVDLADQLEARVGEADGEPAQAGD